MASSRRKLVFGGAYCCSLCNKSTTLLSTPNQWSDEKARDYAITQLHLTDATSICSQCRRDIGKLLRKEEVTPNWEKEKVTISPCCIYQCGNNSKHNSKLSDMERLLSMADLRCKYDTIPIPTPLCEEHYQTVYEVHNPVQKSCITCGSSLRITKPRFCPNPKRIEDILTEKTEYEYKINSGDKVCHKCYTIHLQLLQEDKVISSDSNLSSIISTCINELPNQESIRTEDDIISYAIIKTTITVGNNLLQKEAMLLATAHNTFCHYAQQIAQLRQINISTSIENLVSAKWILLQLKSNLCQHMLFTCRVRKYGTLLYRPGTDMIGFAAQLLWKLKNSQATQNINVDEPIDGEQEGISSETADVAEVMDNLNDRVHKTINSLLKKDSHNPFDSSTMNINEAIQNTDPILFNAIMCLTKSSVEHKGKSTVTDQSSDTYKVKQIRCFFILCAVLFCTDNRCSMPLHTLLTDIIQSQGGSELLIRILNRIGVCSSIDVLQRYIHYQVSNPTNDTDTENATVEIVSIDNIDFLHSYARVFHGTSEKSWHGTTIQIVKPLPSLTLAMELQEEEMETSESRGNGILRKRNERPSPFPSPQKDVTSPLPKKLRRKRTGVDSILSISNQNTIELISKYSVQTTHRCTTKALEDFVCTQEESYTFANFTSDINTYMLYRYTVHQKNPGDCFISIKSFLSLIQPTHTEVSGVNYLEVLHAVADSKETIVAILDDLYDKYVTRRQMEYVIVEGDAKIFEVLQNLKFEYGNQYRWIVPYPGDWHLLKNYQFPLMKAYYDAGLKSLARSCGYQLASIQTCGQFKRTHKFIMEAWESLYRTMLHIFIRSLPGTVCSSSSELISLLQDSITHDSGSTLQCEQILQKALSATAAVRATFFDEFKKFVRRKGREDDTWKFWIQFVFTDALAYIGLYMAIRSGDWSLRIACVKNMAALFTAFDHQNYQKLITQHLCDIKDMPPALLTFFNQGAFVVNIQGRQWHSVGIDEAHEMLINKSCKTSIVKPNPDYISRIARYLPHRTRILDNIQHQVLPKEKEQRKLLSLLSKEPEDIKMQTNIEQQIKCLADYSLLDHAEGRTQLINPFTNQIPSQEQNNDLMNFREIGQKKFLQRISAIILKDPSVTAPNRRNNLRTFSDKKKKSRKMSQLEKDRKLIVSAMRKKMTFSRRTGQPIQNLEEQLIELPLAICDNNGNLNKGQKSLVTKHYENRYNAANPPIFGTSMPWTPEATITEGMFLINTTPLNTHKTLSDYCKFLMQRFVIHEFKHGCQEVHVIFDNPGALGQSPKFFEQKRRDSEQSECTNHYCDNMVGDRKINPKKWREDFIQCRNCKRQLVNFLGNYFLKNIDVHLNSGQTLYVAGCFENDISRTAWYKKHSFEAQPDPEYNSNAEETDSRIWLHVNKMDKNRVLVISPDTDVYHIGLPLDCTNRKEVIIQLSAVNSRDFKIICLSKFISVLVNDPDLSGIDTQRIPLIMQTIYITTGCDYISFFSQIGKSTFLKYFYQYSSFVTAGDNAKTPGTLADTAQSNEDLGYLSFLRLVGTIYFKKHASCFEETSPETHFNSIYSHTRDAKSNHFEWLKDIRTCIWDRVNFENEMIPSNEALLFHWKRTCWISNMWKQADHNVITLEDMVGNGWLQDGDNIKIQWDSDDNRQQVKHRVARLLQGCSCKKGCKTLRCSCKKKGERCNEGCECKNCENMNTTYDSDTCMVDDDEYEEIFGSDNEVYEEDLIEEEILEINDNDDEVSFF